MNEDLASMTVLPQHHTFRAITPPKDSLELNINKARFKNGNLQLLLRTLLDGQDLWLDTSQHPNLKSWTDIVETQNLLRISGSKQCFVKNSWQRSYLHSDSKRN